MTNPAKRKGDSAEREAADLLTELTGYAVRRRLGAGRKDDTGDLDGSPDHAVQVANWADTAAAARIKPNGAEQQAINAGAAYAATLIRFRGGTWRVVLTVEQWTRYLAAINPIV
jgi:Holliday junction resolvase